MGRTFALAAAIFGLALSSAAKADMKSLEAAAAKKEITCTSAIPAPKMPNWWRAASWSAIPPSR